MIIRLETAEDIQHLMYPELQHCTCGHAHLFHFRRPGCYVCSCELDPICYVCGYLTSQHDVI